MLMCQALRLPCSFDLALITTLCLELIRANPLLWCDVHASSLVLWSDSERPPPLVLNQTETLGTDNHQFVPIISIIIFVLYSFTVRLKLHLLHWLRLTTHWEDATSGHTHWYKSYQEEKAFGVNFGFEMWWRTGRIFSAPASVMWWSWSCIKWTLQSHFTAAVHQTSSVLHTVIKEMIMGNVCTPGRLSLHISVSPLMCGLTALCCWDFTATRHT